MRNYFTLVFFICLPFVINAQLTIQDANTPPFNSQNLIRNIFIGSGVEVSNINLLGSRSSVGYFSDGLSQIGLERGIILSTGDARTINTLNANINQDGELTSGFNNPDPDLSSIATGSIADQVVYTFNFIPNSDTVRFRYVFGSEEYPEYVCEQYNDVFGFFISGPSPSGGNYNAENIALVPDPADPSGLSFTSIPVAIDNVHSGMANCTDGFPEYYNQNGVGTENLAINAYLDVFTAQAVVVPCQEYTIKLAIADVNDQLYNSVVFLEAKSFGTGSLQATSETPGVEGGIAEGCVDGFFKFSLPDSARQDLPIDFRILDLPGSATPGVDYDPLPVTLTIPKDSIEIYVPVTVVDDGVDEPVEVIALEVNLNICETDTLYIYIHDNQIVPPILPADVSICPNEELIIDAALDPSIDIPPLYYFSNNDIVEITPEETAVLSGIEVIGVRPEKLRPNQVFQVCIEGLEHRALDELDIYLIGPDGQILELSTDNGNKPLNLSDLDSYTNTCFTVNAEDTINYGNSKFGDIDPLNPTYNGEFLPEGNWSDLWDGDYNTNGTWQLMVIDDTPGGITGRLLGWSISFIPPYYVNFEWTASNGVLECPNCEDITVSPSVSTNYNLEISDAYGCTSSSSMNVTVPDIPTLVILSGPNPTSCYESMDGSATFEIASGNGPFTYTIGQNSNGTGVFNNLPKGDVALVIEDQLGCSYEYFLNNFIPGPDSFQFNVTLSKSDPCNLSGLVDVSVNVTGGQGNLNFLWSDGSTSSQLVGISQGSNYQLTVTDSEGCMGFYDLNIPTSEMISATLDLIDPQCSNDLGSGSVIINAGVGPFTFQWQDGINDSINNSLTPGPGSVIITDAFGCDTTINFSVNEGTVLDFNVMVTNETCPGNENGTAQVEIISGRGPYTIEWSNGSSNMQKVTGLSPGIYGVTVTGSEGCSSETDFDIRSNPGVIFSISKTDILCYGVDQGRIRIDTTGSDPNTTILWNDGSSSPERVNLPVGDYCITLTNGACTVDTCLVIVQPEQFVIELDVKNPGCGSGSDGSITVIGEGGVPPYNYNWTFMGNPLNENSPTINNLSPGVYSVNVADQNNCQIATNATLELMSQLEVTSVIRNSSCDGTNDGSIEITVNGGTPPFDFQWEDMDANQYEGSVLRDLSPGVYALEINDGAGCIFLEEYVVESPEPIIVNENAINISCFGEEDGQIIVDATGGNGGFKYRLNEGDFQNDNTFKNLQAGTYTLHVMDALGCVDSITSIRITEPGALLVDLGPDIILETGQTVSLQIDVFNYAGNLSYVWSSDLINFLSCIYCKNPIFNGDRESTFKVQVTDAKGCQGEDFISIRFGNNTNFQVPTAFTPNGDGENDILTAFGARIALVKTFKVFNRWGELVYEGFDLPINDRSVGWDGVKNGKVSPPGLYYWSAEVEYLNGQTEIFMGNTTLIR